MVNDMTFENILESGFISDDTRVVIKFKIAGRQFTDAGVWFSDIVLNHLNDSVTKFKLDLSKNKITIYTYWCVDISTDYYYIEKWGDKLYKNRSPTN